MNLHKQEENFVNLISLTAQNLGILPIYVEKDYFVVFALKNKIRHIYDLHFLVKHPEIVAFLEGEDGSNEFMHEILVDEAKGTNTSIHSTEWFGKEFNKAIIFSEVESTWAALNSTYRGIFGQMVYGELPKKEEIMKSIRMVGDFLGEFEKWRINNQANYFNYIDQRN